MVEIVGVCPKCHETNTIAVESDIETAKRAIVECDHCGSSHKLSAFRKERDRQKIQEQNELQQMAIDVQHEKEERANRRSHPPDTSPGKPKKHKVALASSIMGAGAILAFAGLLLIVVSALSEPVDPSRALIRELNCLTLGLLSAILYVGRTLNESIRALPKG